jgi:CheY-like chemotaxis protein
VAKNNSLKRASRALADASPPASGVARVLVVDTDRTTLELLNEWLSAEGFVVVAASGRDDLPSGPLDAAVVDVPFARHGPPEQLLFLAAHYPGVPIVVMSSTLFANVENTGACARALGVAAVLPKPIPRAALLATLRHLLGSRP